METRPCPETRHLQKIVGDLPGPRDRPAVRDFRLAAFSRAACWRPTSAPAASATSPALRTVTVTESSSAQLRQ